MRGGAIPFPRGDSGAGFEDFGDAAVLFEDFEIHACLGGGGDAFGANRECAQALQERVAVWAAAEAEPERVGAECAQNHRDVRGFASRRGDCFDGAIDAAGF